MKIASQILLLTLVILCSVACNKPETPTSAAPATNATPTRGTAVFPLTNMVLIKAGTYLRIKFPVTITRDFFLGKYEVTQAEFEKVMGKNPSHFTGDPSRPVEKVTCNDAAAYCAALTKREREAGRIPDDWEYRLPTEGEWEFACRAGSTNQFSFGGETANGGEYAWTQENAEAAPHPVGLKKPNAWGLYDMHGNVWEWCSDWFEPYPATHLTDPTGPPQSKYKVFRGGGWNNDVTMARASNRFMMEPDKGIHFVGFRVALCQTRQ